MVIKKDSSLIPNYYDKGFELTSNGEKMNYSQFVKFHSSIYKTNIQYKIRYDDQAFLKEGDKLAARIFITTKKPNETPKEIEVILIAEYRNDKLYRVWEVTYPDWSKMKPFQTQQISHYQ